MFHKFRATFKLLQKYFFLNYLFLHIKHGEKTSRKCSYSKGVTKTNKEMPKRLWIKKETCKRNKFAIIDFSTNIKKFRIYIN